MRTISKEQCWLSSGKFAHLSSTGKIIVSNENISHAEVMVVFVTFCSISEASTWLFWLRVYLNLLLDSDYVELFKTFGGYLFPLYK